MNIVLKQILDVKNEELDALDTNFIGQYNFYHGPEYFHGKSGTEHYRLLMYIAKLHHRQILFDVGTYRCMSAAALSWTMVNRVKSYDIKKFIFNNPILPSVQYCYGDATEDPDLIKSHFIFLDVDHDGIFEKKLYDHLEKIGWKGLLMMDDIHECAELTTFWNNVKKDKYDLTPKGHWAGTGIINFE